MNKLFVLLLLPFVVTGCSENESSSSSDVHSSSGNMLSKSCISDYMKKPCSLLTTTLVKNTFPQFPDDAEQSEILQLKSCSYEWPSNGRTRSMNIGGREMEIPVSNEIGISWIKKKKIETALKSFKNSYRTLSEEEKARAAAAMQKAFNERSEGLTETQKKMAGSMSKGFLNVKYETIEGVGSAAVWSGSSLKVLDGDTEFQISANVSATLADNIKLASDVAKSLIASCK